jgi:hypothetical protein
MLTVIMHRIMPTKLLKVQQVPVLLLPPLIMVLA